MIQKEQKRQNKEKKSLLKNQKNSQNKKNQQKQIINSSNQNKQYIGQIHECEEHQQTQFIQRGYRINFHTPKIILKSLFMIHNEFVNVWTHLLGSIFCLIFGYYLCVKNQKMEIIQQILEKIDAKVNQEIYEIQDKLISYINSQNLPNFDQIRLILDHPEISRLPIIIFTVSAFLCMFFSAIYHLFNCVCKYINYRNQILQIFFKIRLFWNINFNLWKYFYAFSLWFLLLASYLQNIFDCFRNHFSRHDNSIILCQSYLFLIGFIQKKIINQKELFIFYMDLYHLYHQFTFISIIIMDIQQMILQFIKFYALFLIQLDYSFILKEFLKDLFLVNFGNSHQIWHICVFLGVLFSYLAGIQNFNSRLRNQC